MEDFIFEDCIRQIQKGEKEGLKQIYQAYVGLIYSVIYDMTGNREDAQDITSEFFIRLWDKADTYRFGGKHKAWLLTIARNMTIDFLRKQRKELPMEELSVAMHPRKGSVTLFLGEGESFKAGEQLGTDQRNGDFADEVVGNLSMREAMKLLKPAEQEVLDLKILGGFTFQEIAEGLKKPIGTVSWLYRQGIHKLRKYHKAEQEVQE